MRWHGAESASTGHSLPIDPPSHPRKPFPNQPLRRGAAGMVIKNSNAFIETSRVRRVAEPQSLRVEVMTEFVTKRAEKGSERGHLLSDRRTSPDADQHTVEGIVAKEFGSPAALVSPQRTSCEDTNSWLWNPVEFGSCFKKNRARLANVAPASSHGRFDVLCRRL